MPELHILVIGVAGGLLAGFVNALAGNGSAITLSILMGPMGLPADVANGSNRIGLLAQNIGSTWEYQRKGRLKIRKSLKFVLPMLFGAIIGSLIAIKIDPKQFKVVIGYLMILLLLFLLVKPERWIQEHKEQINVPNYVIYPVFFVLGIYGGFIQMGMGLFMLAALVLGARHGMTDANGIKLFGVLLYTAVIFPIYLLAGDVNWTMGGTIAVGQLVGGWAGAKFAVTHPDSAIWTHRLLILIVVAAIAGQFWG